MLNRFQAFISVLNIMLTPKANRKDELLVIYNPLNGSAADKDALRNAISSQ
jgi:hypothetical protein